MKKLHSLLLLLAIHCALSSSAASLTLPTLFADGMVLQREANTPVWGWTEPGQQITVTLSQVKKQKQKTICALTATADGQGRWQVSLSPQKAGGPFILSITSGEETKNLNDVLFGDVWLCSGQSNMEVFVERVYPQYPEEIDSDSDHPTVRMFIVDKTPNVQGPQADAKGSGWKAMTRESVWHFSALAYFMGKRLQQQTGVPQGLIQTAWGGTPIEAWLPEDSMLNYNSRMVAEARLYRDQQLVRSIQSMNKSSDARWQQLLDEMDPGTVQHWNAPNYDDSQWQKVDQDNLFPNKPQFGSHFCGTFWLRQHVNIDKAHAGKEALLQVGTLIDADITYVNGQQVGRTYYQYPPRRYRVPAGLLREGDNVITIRFINKSGRPSFYKDKPYQLEFGFTAPQPRTATGPDIIKLSRTWLAHDGLQMPQQPYQQLDMHYMASSLWNSMLYPLAPYALAGAVWYQGESNTGRAREYEQHLGCLMHSWRQVFQQPDLPFCIVQLAGYMEPSPQPQNTGWATLRESQRKAVIADPRAELAVAIDLGEASDIHPLRKKELAERVVLCFDKLVYKKNVTLSPQPTAVETTSGAIAIRFDQPLNEGQVVGFELAGSDGKFQNVSATASGNTVTLSTPSAQPSTLNPQHSTLNSQPSTLNTIRYSWKNNPIEANLRGKDNALPAVPFEWIIK